MLKGTLKRKQRGQGMTEYIIIVALVAIGAIAVVSIFGDNVRALFGTSANALTGESGEPTFRTTEQDDVNKGFKDFAADLKQDN